MKRITAITIENYRAFYGRYDIVNLRNGENLLIYGENGSGKSSLFKALNDYLTKSRVTTLSFTQNVYGQNQNGAISVEFADFGANPYVEVLNSRQAFHFGTALTDNAVSFIQDASLIKGFLEYRNLLDVYLHKTTRPNLFQLVVLNLLGNHIPIQSGGTFRFGVKWNQLQTDLIKNSTSRRNNNHRRALTELPVFQQHLVATLDATFMELNRMLQTYFADLSLRLSYDLQNLNFNYKRNKADWFTTAELRLNVYKDGSLISGDYSDVLNEARLSAFSICLYLASLKLNPTVDLQILYLDDIFIGLDAGNRLPILNILESEFSSYQIVISTYDKHWYELAKRHFQTYEPNGWIYSEFYVGAEKVNGISFDKPIITGERSEFDRASRFLHDRTNPDYPAAANYFRKSIEEILQNFIPTYELADTNSIQYPDHKLSVRIIKAKDFFARTNNDTSAIETIVSLLHALIHPLSHFSIKSPVYKRELLLIENAISQLKSQLIAMQIAQTYKCVLDPGKKIKLVFCVDQLTDHYFYYEIVLRTTLILKRNTAGIIAICDTPCYVHKYYGNNGANNYQGGSVRKTDSRYHYGSIGEAYNSIYTYLSTNQIAFSFPANGYQSTCEWFGANGWQPLDSIIMW